MKKYKRLSAAIFSVLLTFILCFTAGETAFASGGEIYEGQISKETAVQEVSVQEISATEASLQDTSGLESEHASSGSTEESLPVESRAEESPKEGSAEESLSEKGSAGESIQESGEETGGQDSSAEEEDIRPSEEDTQAPEASEKPESGEGSETWEESETADLAEALFAALYQALQTEFPGMTEDEMVQELDSMSDEEVRALMERIFSDPEILSLLEAIEADDVLAAELDELLGHVFPELDTNDIIGELEEAVSGTQGDHITWSLAVDGVFTISGKGNITPDYEEFLGEEMATYKWDDYIGYITKIIIKDGVANVPEEAFLYASGLKTVIVPASVTSIESAAFSDCRKLSTVYFMGNAPEIAEDAFEGCSENLVLYYLKGTKGWDRVEGYNLAVWKAASPEESSKETAASEDAAGEMKKESAKPAEISKSSRNVQTAGETPNTGDTADIYPYVILMAAAMICGGIIIIRMRKKK